MSAALADTNGPSVIDPSWDVMQPRGETRVIEFTTDRGTWMSVDISPDGQWLAFDLLGHIYRVSSEGGKATSLTQDSGIAVNYHPRISPDGSEIAFISDRNGQDNLWVMKADGSNARAVAQDTDSRFVEPAWTPDGDFIVVTRRFLKTGLGFRRTDDTIWIYPRTGGKGEEIIGIGERRRGPGMRATDGGWHREDLWGGLPRRQWPAVAPDGDTVYFHSSNFDGTSRHLQRIDLRSGHVEDVTERSEGFRACCARPAHPMQLGEIAPEISPDGRWLAFARRIIGGRFSYRGHVHTGRTALWLRDLHTGKERILMDPITFDAMENLPNWHDRVLPGYSWAKDAKSIVLSHDGQLKRVWIDNGQVESIPFTAQVKRIVSEMARSRIDVSGESFKSRIIRWPSSSPDGTQLVFEAAGQIWIATLPDGTPRPLVAPSQEEVQLMPAWSPDGDWVAYVSIDGALDNKGHVSKVHVQSRESVRLTDSPGIYLSPFWNPMSSAIYVSRWPPALSRIGGAEEQWELVRISAVGDMVENVAKPRARVEGTFGNDGRIYFDAPYSPEARALMSIDPSGADQRLHIAVAGAPRAIVPSPDNKWLAIEQYQDIYLLPYSGSFDERPIDILEHDPPGLRRISFAGGRNPHWRDSASLEFASAGELMIYSVEADLTDRFAVAPSLRRDQAVGTLALTGARIITLGEQGVVEKGTVVVKGAHIACVGRCRTEDADRVIALDNKTIIPGWVDTHAHFTGSDADGVVPTQHWRAALYLAYGITTTLDPSTTADTSFILSEMSEAGRIVGPRIFSAGLAISCGDRLSERRVIETLEDAEEHVQRNTRHGATVIKDYKQCTRTQRQMLAEAARHWGVGITTEQGPLTYILAQIMHGGTGWEHPLQYAPVYSDVTEFLGRAGAHYSGDLLLSSYPHSVIMEYWMGQSDLWGDSRLQLWQPWQRTAARRTFVKSPVEEYLAPIYAEAAADLMKAGGFVTTGSHGEQDGLGLHWEAWTLGMALSPLETLTAASLHGAHFIGLDHAIGSIETGKYADLVVLNSNPLEDIRSTIDNVYVMKAGKLYRTDTLDQVWPVVQPYGSRPWLEKGVFRSDLRNVEE